MPLRLVRTAVVAVTCAAAVLPVSAALSAAGTRSAGGTAQRSPTYGPFELEITPPPAVRRAGGRELREFKEGRRVVAQTGCLACHRIGEDGNPGPGKPLTHIGSHLTERAIHHALIHPRAPMPSFKGLGHRKLHAIVRFLSLLR